MPGIDSPGTRVGRAIRSDLQGLARSLAAEEWLLDTWSGGPPVFMLWSAGPGVVLGKNQNPWKECDTAFVERQGMTLIRRISGGGTVYHDSGNLNYAIIQGRETYDKSAVFARVLEALGRLGIHAERGEGDGLFVDGRKVSGTAFCFRRQAVLHHGTLLVNADLPALQRALTSPLAGVIDTRAIPSRRAEVINLAELLGDDVGMEEVAACLFDAFLPSGTEPEDLSACLPTSVHEAAGSRLAWDRVYGATPPFRIRLNGPLEAVVRRGRVEEWVALQPQGEAWLEGLRERVTGCRFIRGELQRRLDEAGIGEVLAWLPAGLP